MGSTQLISAGQLRTRMAAGPLVLLDVRWSLGGPPGRQAYQAGHLPGAVFVDLDVDLAGSVGRRTGRHPLPAVLDLQTSARRWGVRQGHSVVVYDDWMSMGASRAWWLLRWAGLADVQVLDGGLSAWVAGGGDLTTAVPEPHIGDVVLVPGQLPVLDADRAAELPSSGFLLDARAGERFRGDLEPIYAIAGHIPGATSAPTTENVGPDGRFLPARELATRFTALGVTAGLPVGVYCGSGVTATHEILALNIASIDAALYPGSWSEWISNPDRSVAIGP